ncbi:MAG: ABC transporter ATP-binding protein [Oligoflexia bacterium]|nr:ABC transporter ATP-binding protein [Oligoflexia bacterium]
MTSETPALELRGLRKRFGQIQANEDIHLRVREGSIHAIIGENGAGKSTAMKMVYGLYRPDEGRILLRGVQREWDSPSDAIAAGIGMVHQHFMLAGPYDAIENIVAGAEPEAPAWRFLPRAFRPVDRAGARARLEALSRQYGLQVDFASPVEELAVGVQQRIEILKLLYREASILILDEPTAVLTPQETTELFANLRRLRAEGKTILIITHKLKEVMALADQVTVFRAGRIVGDVARERTNVEELASMMVGRRVNLQIQAPPAPPRGEPVLEVRGLCLTPASSGERPLRELGLEVHAGEIVGIAGVEGNGQSELLQVLLHPRDYRARSQGEIRCLGRTILNPGGGERPLSTARIKALGVGVIPEDRHRQGLLLERPVAENFLLGLQGRAPFSRHGFLSGRSAREAATRALEEYDIRPRSLDVAAAGLSGGNQQKLVIAREFEGKPRLLIAAQPTRGVDVGAIEFIHRRIFRARDEGAGVLLVSSELDEILVLSDRILVIYEGRIVARFARGEASEQELGMHMGGGARA